MMQSNKLRFVLRNGGDELSRPNVHRAVYHHLPILILGDNVSMRDAPRATPNVSNSASHNVYQPKVTKLALLRMLLSLAFSTAVLCMFRAVAAATVHRSCLWSILAHCGLLWPLCPLFWSRLDVILGTRHMLTLFTVLGLWYLSRGVETIFEGSSNKLLTLRTSISMLLGVVISPETFITFVGSECSDPENALAIRSHKRPPHRNLPAFRSIVRLSAAPLSSNSIK